MASPSLATTICLLLGCSAIIIPAVGFAEGEDRNQPDRHGGRWTDYVERGHQSIQGGDEAMKRKDYKVAHEYYKHACDVIPGDPKPDPLHRQALDKFDDASIKLAEQWIAEGRYADAESVLKVVLDERYDPHCEKAVVLLSRLEPPNDHNKTVGPKFRTSVEQIKQYLIEAQGFYDTGLYALARKRCEQVLEIDPYYQAAREFEEKVDRVVDDSASKVSNEARAKAVRDADDPNWRVPKRKYNIEAVPVIQTDGSATATEKIRRKLEHIIIPKLEFREATIREAIDFLKKKCVDLDSESPAGERGLNIVLKLDEPSGATAAPAANPEAQTVPIPGVPTSDAGPAPAALDTRITVSLTNIPLIEALKYVTGLANLKFKIEPEGISIVPLSASAEVLVTKEWKIPPDLIPRTPAAGGSAQGISAPATGGGANGAEVADAAKAGSGVADRVIAKNWLIANGVTFNGQASAIYVVKNSRLIVRNTQDQLDLVDTIISASVPGKVPVLVEIECKFVEIQQNDIKAGIAGVRPLTSGNRDGGNIGISENVIEALLFPTTGASSLAPGIGAIAGVFTDPQFQLLIRALNRKKGVDLLSVPKVTAKSGQPVVIEVIREFRSSPELKDAESAPPQILQSAHFPIAVGVPGAGGGTNSKASSIAPTTPPNVATHNTGITLEVTPVVGPDGYTIDLNLVPQVVEFDGFMSYGSPITSKFTNPNTGVSRQDIVTPIINNHPISGARKVTTSVSVFDGSTVVLGGLLREDVQKRTEIGTEAEKPAEDLYIRHNLLIFVTARLVNPASGPVGAGDEKEEVIDLITPPEILPIQKLPLMPK